MHPKHLLIIVLIFCSSFAAAQIKKGTVFIGGNLNFSIQNYEDGVNKNHSIGLSPMIGKAVRENFVAGFALNYVNQKSTDYDTSTTDQQWFGAGLFLRRYLEIGNGFYVFAHGNAGAAYTTLETNAQFRNDEKGYSINISAYPGISYQVNRKLHLEAALSSLLYIDYTNRKVTRTNGSTYRNKSFALGTSLSNGANLSVGIRFLLAPR